MILGPFHLSFQSPNYTLLGVPYRDFSVFYYFVYCILKSVQVITSYFFIVVQSDYCYFGGADGDSDFASVQFGGARVEGQAECKQCPAGTSTLGLGSISQTDCGCEATWLHDSAEFETSPDPGGHPLDDVGIYN